MKLLTPTQAQGQAKIRTEKDERRAVEVQTLLVAKYKELAEAERAFKEALERNQGLWAAEESAHQATVTALQAEVVSLEERKAQALLPLTEHKKELDTITSALEIRTQSLNEREASLDEQAVLLTEKLDAVSEREIQLDDHAARLERREAGILLQEQSIRQTSEGFTAALMESNARLAQREKAVVERENKIVTRENHLTERERIVQETSAGFDKREAALKDKYETLERTIKRNE